MKKISINRMFITVGCYCLFANFAHPITPTFIQNLGLHDYMFGVAFACMAITNFLFSPFWGKLAKSKGICLLSAICYIGYGVGQFIFGTATTEFQIIAARLFAGFFIGGISVSQLLYIMENSDPEHRSQNLAILAAITSIMSPFGFLVGGFLGDISIFLTFMVQVAGLCLTGVLVFVWVKDKPREEVLDVKAVMKESNPFSVMFTSKGLLTTYVIVFLAVATFTSFATTCYEQCFNYFIKDQFGFPSSYNGILKAAVGFITLIANATITMWLIKKTEIRKTIIHVLVICALMMAAIVVIDDIVPFIVINVVFFGFNAIYQPLLQSILSFISNKNEGTLVGIYNSMRSFGMIFGSLLAGFIYGIGPKLSFVTAGIAFLISAVLAYVNYRQYKQGKGTINA